MLRKIEFQKQVAVIEKEFKRLQLELMKEFPIQVNDLVNHGSGIYKISRVELLDNLDWKVELFENISFPNIYHFSIEVFGLGRLKLNEWSEKATELDASKIFQINGIWIDPFELGIALKPIANKE